MPNDDDQRGPLRRRLPALPLAVVRRRLAPFSPNSGRRVLVLVTLASVATVAETVALVLVAQAAVGVTAGQQRVPLGLGIEVGRGAALGLALAALAAKLALSVAGAWVAARLSAQTVRVGRLSLLDSYFASDWRTQSQERLGELQDYLTTSVGRLNGVNQALSSGLTAMVSFAVIIAAAVLVNPLAAVGCAVATAAVLLVLRPLSRLTKEYSWAQSDATRDLATDVTEAVRVTQEVRVFGVRSGVLRQLDRAEARTSRPLLLGNFTALAAPTAYQVLALSFLVLAVAALDVAGTDEVGSLGAAVLLLLRGLTYGQQLQTALHSLSSSVPFLDALHERKLHYDAHAQRRGTVDLTDVGEVALQDVCFSYDGAPVLESLSFSIGRAESVGIVGPSGSGKSTLLQLLLRLRPPTSGAVRVDGIDLWDITAQAWASKVAFVPQDARLLNGTVADNIRFFRDLDQSQVERAARLAHIADDIASWPAGYDTLVGDAGNRVSGGQRQRIAIARALAGSPDLLILDEPTSALDLLSEARLQSTLSGLKGQVGLIIVAHRLSTIKHCDRVLVLQDGRCQGFDAHERLLESSPFYREAMRLSILRTDVPVEATADRHTGVASGAGHEPGSAVP